MRQATELLIDYTAGDKAAANQLLPMVYDELRAMAAACLRGERRYHTLQPTALVHEAFLRLIDHTRIQWQGRAHFLALAATTMRRVLLDHARKKRARKRAQGERITLTDEIGGAEPSGSQPIDLLALDEALNQLAADNPRWARLVELRFFGGLSVQETASVLGIAEVTAKVDWRYARAWLTARLQEGEAS